jgi:hypothetical protein
VLEQQPARDPLPDLGSIPDRTGHSVTVGQCYRLRHRNRLSHCDRLIDRKRNGRRAGLRLGNTGRVRDGGSRRERYGGRLLNSGRGRSDGQQLHD